MVRRHPLHVLWRLVVPHVVVLALLRLRGAGRARAPVREDDFALFARTEELRLALVAGAVEEADSAEGDFADPLEALQLHTEERVPRRHCGFAIFAGLLRGGAVPAMQMRQLAFGDFPEARVPKEHRAVPGDCDELIRDIRERQLLLLVVVLRFVEYRVLHEDAARVDLRPRGEPSQVRHAPLVRRIQTRQRKGFDRRRRRCGLVVVAGDVGRGRFHGAVLPPYEHFHGHRGVPQQDLAIQRPRRDQMVLLRIEGEAAEFLRRLEHELRVYEVGKIPDEDKTVGRPARKLDPVVKIQVADRRHRDHALVEGVPVDAGEGHVLRVQYVVKRPELLEFVLPFVGNRRLVVADAVEGRGEDVDGFVLLKSLLD
mmetsp:Transcript_3777/g.11517  ORF Transcript_3777/g.11517 Transcript_3777/m.11517 type:complete len:370 (+) Transcript_3777:795-1904(+)